MKIGGNRTEGSPGQDGLLARRRVQSDAAIGSRAALDELDDD